MRLTDAQEGIIVRCIQRLDEVCKDVRKAARIVGDPALFEKMGETSAAIRRGGGEGLIWRAWHFYHSKVNTKPGLFRCR